MAIAPTSHAAGTAESKAMHVGLCMSAEEFLQIPDDGVFYELIDGVVFRSPSPAPEHQRITMRISYLVSDFLEKNPVGEVFAEIDVHLGEGPQGGDLVYRPELLFIRAERMASMEEGISGPPDMVLEVISRGSRRMDVETKRNDYERCGVREYWLADPMNSTITFFRLIDGRFQEVQPSGDHFRSEAIPGFSLDLNRVREAFRPR